MQAPAGILSSALNCSPQARGWLGCSAPRRKYQIPNSDGVISKLRLWLGTLRVLPDDSLFLPAGDRSHGSIPSAFLGLAPPQPSRTTCASVHQFRPSCPEYLKQRYTTGSLLLSVENKTHQFFSSRSSLESLEGNRQRPRSFADLT